MSVLVPSELLAVETRSPPAPTISFCGTVTFHIESSEVREKFGVGVELMAVPCIFPPDADLREPLADHIEIVGVAGALDDFGKHVVKVMWNCTDAPGAIGFRQGDLKNGVVFRVVIVRLDEFHFVGQIARAFDFQLVYGDRAEMFGIPSESGPLPRVPAGALRS